MPDVLTHETHPGHWQAVLAASTAREVHAARQAHLDALDALTHPTCDCCCCRTLDRAIELIRRTP